MSSRGSPLAVDGGAAQVRELLEQAAEHAFGDTENERLLQRVLVRGYITPAASHEQAADELNLAARRTSAA